MARAVVFSGPGHPLDVVPFSVPDPGPGELLVRTTLCTLCRSDLHTHAGRRTEPVPTVLGHEVVGRIEAFGPGHPSTDAGGRPARTGDRVTWSITTGCGTCYFCRADLPQKCSRLVKFGHRPIDGGPPVGGGLSESVVLPPGTVWYRVPDEIDDAVAAPANCSTATAAGLVRHAGDVSGRTVLILGAGVLGVTTAAMARTAGAATVLVAEPIPDLRERARLFGATDTVSSDLDDVARAVAAATDGRGADVVVELAGTAASARTALGTARVGGTVLLAGTVAPTPAVPLDPEAVVRRMLTIRGVHNYHPRDLESALSFLAGPGRAFPFDRLVVARYPLAEAERAFATAHTSPGYRIAVVPGEGE
jgi:alcohol dehydrogenase